MDLDFLKEIEKTQNLPFQKRIIIQIKYALQLNKYYENKFTNIIETAINYLNKNYSKTKFISKKVTQNCEKILLPLEPIAKKQTVICVAHAHTDLNWCWGFDETVNVITSTIETMLYLLEKYPTFTFAQSQAFEYEVLKKYRPDLLKKVKKYVKQGRFDISTASTYVEEDKNLSNGELQVQQIIQAKNYLSNLFNLPKDYFCIDFKPDTFGHTEEIPEILAQAGIKYYYHCRGNDLMPIYRWHSPSGKSVLVYREPFWYLDSIKYDTFNFAIDFSKKYKTDYMLKVYGIGDHGGGASVKDIEKIIEISKFPIMPNIKFGTFKEFFELLEKNCKNLPDIYGNQSKIFTGCYSSMSEIKDNNFKGQETFFNLNSLYYLTNKSLNKNLYNKPLNRLLFNQFHDILPGSGVNETKNYALGEYQKSFAEFGCLINLELNYLRNNIDTSTFFNNNEVIVDDISIGAGSGFNSKNLNFSQQLAYGKTRVYLIINTQQINLNKYIKIQVWDYNFDINNIEIFDSNNKKLDFYIVSKDSNFYWQHYNHEILVNVNIDKFGFDCIILKQKKNKVEEITYPPLFQRTEDEIKNIVLENDLIRYTFDFESLKLISIFDKEYNKEYLKNPAELQLIYEDDYFQMTSWYYGRIKKEIDLHQFNSIKKDSIIKNSNLNSFVMNLNYNDKINLDVKISLFKNSKVLHFDSDCDFFIYSSLNKGVPTIRFKLPLLEQDDFSCGDIAMGASKFEIKNQDVPYQSFIAVKDVMLIGKAKHGFRYDGENLYLTLLRGTYDPHPYSEIGKRYFSFAINIDKSNISNKILLVKSLYYEPFVVTLKNNKGKIPFKNSTNLNINDLVISNIYLTKNKSLFIRLYNPNFYNVTLNLKQVFKNKEISKCDIFENIIEKINNDKYEFSHGEMLNLLIQ